MTTENTSKQSTNSTTGRDGVDVRCLVQHLDLFSGIGGFALAAKWVGGIETIGFCEIDEWAQKVLKKNFPDVPIHGDVKTLDPKNYGRIDLITGGYPCQPFSVAGERRGSEDDRHLWPEVFRIIKQTRPRWVLCENVAGHIKLGLDEVISNMESIGYTCQPVIIPACAMDAWHSRKRVWIVAHTSKVVFGGKSSALGRKGKEGAGFNASAQSSCKGVDDATPERGMAREFEQRMEGRAVEPSVDRVADGLPSRLDRLGGLGNAIDPHVAAKILRAMMTTDSLLNV